MENGASTVQQAGQPKSSKKRGWFFKAMRFILITALFGWFFAWASPKFFPRETRAGFGYGMLHGALMPMALPSLVMGQDVEIFAANNDGRLYKIGYIAGINLCGLIFFGSIFWSPGKGRFPVTRSGP